MRTVRCLPFLLQGSFLPESATDLSPDRLYIQIRHDEGFDHLFNTSEDNNLWQVGVVPPGNVFPPPSPPPKKKRFKKLKRFCHIKLYVLGPSAEVGAPNCETQ